MNVLSIIFPKGKYHNAKLNMMYKLSYDKFVTKFMDIFDRHAPLKHKYARNSEKM